MTGATVTKRMLAIVAPLAALGCTPLTAFDALVPKDRNVEVIARDVAYGPGNRQQLDVYRPRGDRSGKLPVIVFFYGGSWNSGTRNGYSFVGRALASRGFLVVIPDYRLVPEVRYPSFIEDGAMAVSWTVENAARFGGDPDQLVLAGHSAGAYNAAMLAYDSRWLGARQHSICGFIGLAGPYDFLPLTGAVTRAAFRGTADLASTQPINLVQPGAPPAFLATGTGDQLVLPRNSDALARALEKVGSSVVRRSYPKLGHVGLLTALARPFRGRAPVLDDIALFAHAVTRSQISPGNAATIERDQGKSVAASRPVRVQGRLN